MQLSHTDQTDLEPGATLQPCVCVQVVGDRDGKNGAAGAHVQPLVARGWRQGTGFVRILHLVLRCAR